MLSKKILRVFCAVFFLFIAVNVNLYSQTKCPVTILTTSFGDINCDALGGLKEAKTWKETLSIEIAHDGSQTSLEKKKIDFLGGVIVPDSKTINNIMEELNEGGETYLAWIDKIADQGTGVDHAAAYKKIADDIIKNYPTYNVVLLSRDPLNKASVGKEKQYLLTVVNPYKDWLGRFFIDDPSLEFFNYNFDYQQENYKPLNLYYGGTDYNFSNVIYKDSGRYLIASDNILSDASWQDNLEESIYKKIIFRGAVSKIADTPVVDHVFAELVFSGTDQYAEIKQTLNKALEFIDQDVESIVAPKKKEIKLIRDVRIAWTGNQTPEVYSSYYNKLIKDMYDPQGTLFKSKKYIALPFLLTIKKMNHYLLIIFLVPYTSYNIERYNVDKPIVTDEFKGKTVLCFGDGKLGAGGLPVAEYLNAYYGATAYSLDIAYTGLSDKDNLSRMRVDQDVAVASTVFLDNINKLIPATKNGVDYVLGEDVLCCIACSDNVSKQATVNNPARYSELPDIFDAVATENTILNTIAILKDGGKAKFIWTSHCSYALGEDFGVKSFYEKIIKEIEKDNPNVEIKLEETISFLGARTHHYTMTIYKKLR